MPGTAVRQPVVVEIEGVTSPARFGRLEDAIPAVWASLKPLPLDYETFAAYELLFGPNADPQCIRDFIDRDGQLTLTFAMAGQTRIVRIRPADGGAR